MPFETTINQFVQALADPSGPTPANTLGREGRPDKRRLAVYRNNIAVGLIAALEFRYPVTRQLVGAAFFRAMARAFVVTNRPKTPVLIHYGSGFSDFIGAFEPAQDIAYLPDVARLQTLGPPVSSPSQRKAALALGLDKPHRHDWRPCPFL
jgi:hypothetical protein